jgi:hypothetical protein
VNVKKLVYMLLACAGVAMAVAQATAVELYRFENEDGVVVLAHSIPPELVYKGYTVVSEDGTVLRQVPRQLTPAEIVERDRKLAEEKAAEEGRMARAHRDEELAKLYASPADVIEARDRKLRSIDNAIATTKGNIARLKLQKQHLEEQAAERERAGLLASPEILENLKILTVQIGDKEREVEMRELEQQQVREQFQHDLERFEELFGSAPVAATATEPAN